MWRIPVSYTHLDVYKRQVIGNVPFGDIRVNDRRYNKHNFLIHDYFFAKSLDTVSYTHLAVFEVYLKSAGSFANAKESERDTLICDENGFAQTKDMPCLLYTSRCV